MISSATPRAFRELPVSGDVTLARTLAKGLAVLATFDVHTPTLGNAEIAIRIGMPRPTVARLTRTLAEIGYLAYDPQAAKYRLWGGVLRLGYPLLAEMKVRQTARPLMHEFANGVRGTVSIGILDGLDLVYVETARAADVAHHGRDIGSSVRLPQAAMGRALWSMLDDLQSDRLQARFEVEAPDVWARFGERVCDARRECAERGFCASRGDWVTQVHAVAAPLFVDASTGFAYAINCGVEAFRLGPEQLDHDIGPRLASLAGSIRSLCGQD